jgi:hypothetical protein
MKKRSGILDYILTDPYTTSSDHWRNLFDETLDSIQNSITSLVDVFRERAEGKVKLSKEQLRAELRTFEAIVNLLKSLDTEPQYAWEIDKLAFNPDGTVKTKYLINSLSSSLFSLYSCILKQYHGKITASIVFWGKKEREKEKPYKDYDDFLKELYETFKERSLSGDEALLQELDNKKAELIEFLYQSQAKVSSLVLNRIFEMGREKIVLHQLKSIASNLERGQIIGTTSALRSLFCAIASGGLATNRVCLSSLSHYLGISGEVSELEVAIKESGEKERRRILLRDEVAELAKDIYLKSYARLLFLAQALYTLYPIYTEGKDKSPKCGKFNIAPALSLLKSYLDGVFGNFLEGVNINISDTPEGIASGAAAILTYFVVDTIIAKLTGRETDKVYSEFYGIADYITGDINGWLENIKSISKAFFEEVNSILKEVKRIEKRRNVRQERNVSGSVYKFSQGLSPDLATRGVDDDIIELINAIIESKDSRSIPKELEDKAKEILNKVFGNNDDNVLTLFYTVATYRIVLQNILNSSELPSELIEKISANVERSNELFANLKARIKSLLMYIDKVILSAERGKGSSSAEKIKEEIISRLRSIKEIKEKAADKASSTIKKIIPDIKEMLGFLDLSDIVKRRLIRRIVDEFLKDKSYIKDKLCPLLCDINMYLQDLEDGLEDLSEGEKERLRVLLIDEVYGKLKQEIDSVIREIAVESIGESDSIELRKVFEGLLNVENRRIVEEIGKSAIGIVSRVVIEDRLCECIGENNKSRIASLLILGRSRNRSSPRPGYDSIVRGSISFENFARAMVLVGGKDDSFISAALKAAELTDPVLSYCVGAWEDLYEANSNNLMAKERKGRILSGTARRIRKKLVHVQHKVRGSRNVLTDRNVWGATPPYDDLDLDEYERALGAILGQFNELLDKHQDDNVPLNEKEFEKYSELVRLALKATERFLYSVTERYIKYLFKVKDKILEAKANFVKKYQENLNTIMAGLSVGTQQLADKIKKLDDVANILRNKGIDTKSSKIGEIYLFATGILNEKLFREIVGKEFLSYTAEVGELYNKVEKIYQDLNNLPRQTKKIPKPIKDELEKLFKELSVEYKDTLTSLEKNFNSYSPSVIVNALSDFAKKGAEIRNQLQSLKSGNSIFGYSNDQIIQVIDETISNIINNINALTKIKVDTLPKRWRKLDDNLEIISKVLGKKTAAAKNTGDTSGNKNKKDVKSQDPNKQKKAPSTPAQPEKGSKPSTTPSTVQPTEPTQSTQPTAEELKPSAQLPVEEPTPPTTPTVQPTTTPSESEPKPAPQETPQEEAKSESGVEEVDLPQSVGFTKLHGAIVGMKALFLDTYRFLAHIYNVFDYSGNLADFIKFQKRAHLDPVYFLIAKKLGVVPEDVKDQIRRSSNILIFVKREDEHLLEEEPESKPTEPEEAKVPEAGETVVKPEEPKATETPEAEEAIEEEEEVKPEEVVREVAREVPRQKVTIPEEEEIEDEEIAPQVEEVVEVEEEAEPEERTAEAEPEAETEAEPETEEREMGPVDAEELAETMRESVVGGSTVEELEELESGSDEAILSRINKMLSSKIERGEVKVANDLKNLYPVLYIVAGKEVADYAANYYGSLMEGFVTFSIRVTDEELLNRVLELRNLSQDEKKVVLEIKKRLEKDKELINTLRDKKKIEQNILDIVNKVNSVIEEVWQIYGETLDNILKKSYEHLSVGVNVDRNIVPSIRDHIRKNIQILELARGLISEDILSPHFLDDEEKVKVIDSLFKVEGDLLQKYLSRTLAEKLKSKNIIFEKDEYIKLLKMMSSTYYLKFKERYEREVPYLWHSLSAPNGELAFAYRKYRIISQMEEKAPSIPITISAGKLQLLMNIIKEKGINIPDEEIEKISDLMDTANLIVETAESFVNGGISEFLRGRRTAKEIADFIAKGINEAFNLEETNELSEAVKEIPEAKTKDLVNIASKFSDKAKDSLKDVLEKSGIDVSKIMDKVQNDVFAAFIEYARDKRIKISENAMRILDRVKRLPVGKDLKEDFEEMLMSSDITEEDLISMMNYLLFDVVFVNVVILKELLNAVASGSSANREEAEKILKEILSNSILSDLPPNKRKVALDNFVEAIMEDATIPPIVLELPVGRNTKFGKIFIEVGGSSISEDDFRLFTKYIIGEISKIISRAAYSGLLNYRTSSRVVWDLLRDFLKSLRRMIASLLFGPVEGDKRLVRIYRREFREANASAIEALKKIEDIIAGPRSGPRERDEKAVRIIKEAERELARIGNKLYNARDILSITKSIELSKSLVDIAAVALSRLFEDSTNEEFKAMARSVENLSRILYGYVTFVSKTIKVGFVDDLPEIAALLATHYKKGKRSSVASLKLLIVKKAAVGDEITLEDLAEMLYNQVEQNNSVAHYYLLQKVLEAIAIRDSIANGLPIDLAKLLKEFKSNNVFLELATLQFAINKL